MSATTTIYYVANGAIVRKENMAIKSYPKDLLTILFTMRLEQQEITIYDSNGNVAEPPLEEETDYIIVSHGTSAGVSKALVDEERYVPPPIMASLAICPYFRHVLIEVRDKDPETVRLHDMLEREVLIIVDLLRILTKEEDEPLYADKPHIRDAVINMRSMSRLDNSLYRTFSVLNELRSYFGMAESHPERIQQNFISIIYYRDMPWMMISTTVTAIDSFEQQRIVRLPSAWIYGIEHKDNTEMRNMSLLLHSITSYSMLQIFPRLRLLTIPSPYPIMAEILKTASKKYGFHMDPPGYRIDIVRETQWLNIWKQWVATCDSCCFEPAKWNNGSENVCQRCHSF